jgi:hypothetical protein
VEQQWLVSIDQELIEREATRCGVGNAGREAVDAIGDLMRAGLHRCSPLFAFSRTRITIRTDQLAVNRRPAVISNRRAASTTPE